MLKSKSWMGRNLGAATALLSLSFCIAAFGQSGGLANASPQQLAQLFQKRAFAQCGESFFTGLIDTDSTGCLHEGQPLMGLNVSKCQIMMEMRVGGGVTPAFRPAMSGGPISEAQRLNGLEWQGAITFNYTVARLHLRADGVWLKPQPWKDMRPPVPVALMWKRNGQWYLSDHRMIAGLYTTGPATTPGTNVITMIQGALSESSGMAVEGLQDAFGSAQPADQALASLNQAGCENVSSAEAASSAAQAGMVPHSTAPDPSLPSTASIPTAPGHSLDDNYARTLQIVQENQARGINDPLGRMLHLFGPIPVCSSFTGAPLRCVPTGEVVRVPGDLVTPPGFWSQSSPAYFGRQCRGGSLFTEITLNGPTDGRKRYMTCTALFNLSAERQNLATLGAR
jgi:hypothetical protein